MGNLFVWASPAAVSRLAVPGPALAVQNIKRFLNQYFEYPAAANPILCSF